MKIPSLAILTFFGVFCINSCLAQHIAAKDTTVSSQTIWKFLKDDATNALGGVKHSITQPLRWKGDDFRTLGILFAGTATLTFADNSVRKFSQNNAADFPKLLRDFGWYFGSPQNFYMTNAGLYGFGLVTKNEKIRKTSVLIFSSSVTTGLLQTIGKNAIGRARPSTEQGYLTFSSFANDAGFRSFPSGHTVLSVTMAHSIAKQFENIWIKAGIYCVGAIAPISRLIDDAHWLTDIAFSTALSIIVVDSIDNYLFNKKAYEYSKKNRHISWNLKFGANQIGVVGSF
ncbi:MAG: phosphatase PAP2 family protein [Algicola sp.]|nr:phosphatase PAP2 family protein [Algicola sp.]